MTDSLREAQRIAWSRSGWLSGATALLWLVLSGPAWYVAGPEGMIGLSCAAGLCLTPGWIVFWMAARFGVGGAQVPLVILGGTTLRLLFVLIGMLILQTADPRLGFREFTVWLLAFYLSTLAIETVLVLAPTRGEQPRTGWIKFNK